MSEYLVIDEAVTIQNIPGLGEGYDPERGFAEARKQSAVSFDVEELRRGAISTEVKIFEMSDETTSSGNMDASLGVGYGNIAKAKMGLSTSFRLLERYAVFIVYAKFIVESSIIKNLRLSRDISGMTRDQFRDLYGPQLVRGIDKGGYITLLYRFNTRDSSERRNILLSLQASYSGATGSGSFSQTLESHGVKTEYTLYNLQDGGSIAPFLDTNLSAFRSYLDRWTDSVKQNPVPAKVLTADYKQVLVNFPFEWTMGFGEPVIVTGGSGFQRSSVLFDVMPFQGSSERVLYSKRKKDFTRGVADSSSALSGMDDFNRFMLEKNSFDTFFSKGRSDLDRIMSANDGVLRKDKDDDTLSFRDPVIFADTPGFGDPVIVADPDFQLGDSVNSADWAGVSRLQYDASQDPDFRGDGILLLEYGMFVVGGTDSNGRAIPTETQDRFNLWQIPLKPGRFTLDVQKTGLEYLNGCHPWAMLWISVAYDTRDNVRYLIQYTGSPNSTFARLFEKGADHGTDWPFFPMLTGFKQTAGTVTVNNNIIRIDGDIPDFDNRLHFRNDAFRHVFFECFRTEKPGDQIKRFGCPIFLRWDRSQQAYFLEVEGWFGTYDLKDQIIKVSYHGNT